jgi:hypothetical protein
MIYLMNISIQPRVDVAGRTHAPIRIETVKTSRPEITDEEIESVSGFLKQQVKNSLLCLIRG